MALDMHAITVPVYTKMLNNLLALFDKAEAHATEKKFDVNVLLASRLAPDMLPFSAQVQIATDQAKGAVARLAGIEIPKFEDTEKTLDDLRARVRKTLAFIATATAAQMAGSESREVVLDTRTGKWAQPGLAYLMHFAMPNFYFHVTTAYDLLRFNGVGIGKTDFIGPR